MDVQEHCTIFATLLEVWNYFEIKDFRKKKTHSAEVAKPFFKKGEYLVFN